MSTDDRPSELIADSPAAPPTSSWQIAARCLAIVSAAAAVIHFAVADAHYQEYWAFGVFMIVVAIAQLSWCAVAVVEPRRWMWLVGAVLNSGIVAVYIVTRTVGDVVGPTPHELEPVGFGDALCTGLEALIAIGCVALLLNGRVRLVPPRPAGFTVGATGVVMAGLLVVALLDGGPEMSMSMSADGGSMQPAAANATTMQPGADPAAGMSMNTAPVAKLHLKTNSPAGAITMPRPMAQMAAGMRMASGPCTAAPTTAQQQATVRLVNRSWTDAQKYRSLDTAKAAGYTPITPPGLAVVHYINAAYYIKTAQGRRVIDPSQPQSLVYANTPKGAVLVASMFIMTSTTARPPQPGGCLTQWHLHTNLCFGQFANVVAVTKHNTCPAGSSKHITPPMLHVWYVPIPGGPTAVDAPDNQIVKAAEHVRAPSNTTA